MIKKNNSTSDPRDLEVLPLQVAEYHVLAVQPPQSGDVTTAIVTIRDKNGKMDGKSVHIIELTNLYNKLSSGKNSMPYDYINGLFFKVFDIQSSKKGKMDIINWELIIPENWDNISPLSNI